MSTTTMSTAAATCFSCLDAIVSHPMWFFIVALSVPLSVLAVAVYLVCNRKAIIPRCPHNAPITHRCHECLLQQVAASVAEALSTAAQEAKINNRISQRDENQPSFLPDQNVVPPVVEVDHHTEMPPQVEEGLLLHLAAGAQPSNRIHTSSINENNKVVDATMKQPEPLNLVPIQSIVQETTFSSSHDNEVVKNVRVDANAYHFDSEQSGDEMRKETNPVASVYDQPLNNSSNNMDDQHHHGSLATSLLGKRKCEVEDQHDELHNKSQKADATAWTSYHATPYEISKAGNLTPPITPNPPFARKLTCDDDYFDPSSNVHKAAANAAGSVPYPTPPVVEAASAAGVATMQPPSFLPTPLLTPEDRLCCSTFTYYVLSQYLPCVWSKTDSRTVHRKTPVGFPGIACRHCLTRYGSDKFANGKFFLSMFASFEKPDKGLYAWYNHLKRCSRCPEDVSKTAEAYFQTHKEERKTLGLRRHSELLLRIWNRLHKPDNNGAVVSSTSQIGQSQHASMK